MTNKIALYKVTCRGMTSTALGTQVPHGIAYVLAHNPGEAYDKHRAFLDEENLGYDQDRELDKVELVAQVGAYPPCRTHLHL